MSDSDQHTFSFNVQKWGALVAIALAIFGLVKDDTHQTAEATAASRLQTQALETQNETLLELKDLVKEQSADISTLKVDVSALKAAAEARKEK